MKKLCITLLWVFFISFASAQYFQDYENAYNRAYENWIVTEKTIWDANLYSAITRAEFSSILMWYAKNILKIKDTNNTNCRLQDIGNLNSNYQKAVQWTCKMWIMWVWQTFFNPYDSITLASFWTTLSRLYWWEKFSDWTPYYINHIWALKSIWIIGDISDPFKILLKWDVIVMLMNSVKSINYSNPIKTNSHNSAELKEHNSASSIDNKIAKCYREVDECRNYAWNSDIACQYICCNKDWKWVTPRSTEECAPRPGEKTEIDTENKTNTSNEEKKNNTNNNENKSTKNKKTDSETVTGSTNKKTTTTETPTESQESWDDKIIWDPLENCSWNWSCWTTTEMVWDIWIVKIWAKWEWKWKISDKELEKAIKYLWEDKWYWYNREIDAVHKDNLKEDQKIKYKDEQRLSFSYSWD